jgi:glutamate 5-kinase
MDVSKYKLVVIKIGTNTIIDEHGLRRPFLTEIVSEVTSLLSKGKKVVIVTSGAIGMGKRKLFIEPKTVAQQQGLAAIGQTELMNEYMKRFESMGLTCAQLLLSQRDLMEKECLSNLHNTLNFLFEHHSVPIVNENDVVATEELRKEGFFSDNDALSALLSKQINADLLVMLTSKNGLIARDGSVLQNFSNLGQLCQMGESSKDGRGGINSKIKAIQTANAAKCDVFVSGPSSFKGFSEGKASGTFAQAKK